MRDKAADIPIDSIIEPRTVLRLVDKDSVEYLELRDSIEAEGFWNSIAVRPAKDEGNYEIIDGLYRHTCARELGLKSIPCIIKYDVLRTMLCLLPRFRLMPYGRRQSLRSSPDK